MKETMLTITIKPTRKAIAAKARREYLAELRLQILQDEEEMRQAQLNEWAWQFMANAH